MPNGILGTPPAMAVRWGAATRKDADVGFVSHRIETPHRKEYPLTGVATGLVVYPMVGTVISDCNGKRQA